jgi:hypothetical protein
MENPFRLLDLPAEIRDGIYYQILYIWPTYPIYGTGTVTMNWVSQNEEGVKFILLFSPPIDRFTRKPEP